MRTECRPACHLLELCLDTTYFMFEGQFYCQTHGAAMVSPIVANLYMENFEEKALSTTTITPDIWLRYVDDTFTVLQTFFGLGRVLILL